MQARRGCVIEALLDRDCDLAFLILHAWSLSHVEAYCSAARHAVQRRDTAQLERLLSNIKRTAAASEFDKVRLPELALLRVSCHVRHGYHRLHGGIARYGW